MSVPEMFQPRTGPDLSFSAERALEARVKVEEASRLVREAAKLLDDADIPYGLAKALRGISDCMSIIHRKIDDHWAHWRDTVSTKAAEAGMSNRAGPTRAKRPTGEE